MSELVDSPIPASITKYVTKVDGVKAARPVLKDFFQVKRSVLESKLMSFALGEILVLTRQARSR